MSSDEEGPPTPSSDDDTKSSEAKVPESEVHFAFGPQNWYWIRCGTQWRFVRWNTSIWGDTKIDDPYWVTFKHENGFFLGGEGVDGEGRVIHNWNGGYMVRADSLESYVESRDAYGKLHDWINDRVVEDSKKVKKLSVTIGPRGSYFARFGSSHITHALPKDLQQAIEESETYPLTIALGAKSTWIAIWADGSRSWNLCHAYPSLASNGFLRDDENKAVFAALNPFNEDRFFIVSENGVCSYNADFSEAVESRKVYGITDTYMRSRAKRDGSTLIYEGKVNGWPKQVKITPNSNAEETKTDALLSVVRGSTGMVKHNDLAFVGAVAGGAGVLTRVAGLPTLKAIGVGTSMGIGAALHMWYRG